jgi:uncharacterized protein YuzE
MADKVKIWYDREGDFLEVTFAEGPGHMRHTANDAVMERVDERGNIIGFSILEVSRLAAEKPLEAELATGGIHRDSEGPSHYPQKTKTPPNASTGL